MEFYFKIQYIKRIELLLSYAEPQSDRVSTHRLVSIQILICLPMGCK